MARGFSLDTFLGMHRVSGLAVSPDGLRLVTTVAAPAADRRRYTTSLWELDPAGQRPPRRLTWGEEDDSAPRFAADGAVLFLATRPIPGTPAPVGGTPARSLWRLPAEGGEAQPLTAPPGGVDGFRIGLPADLVVVAAETHPGTASWDEDSARQAGREDAGVEAQLFERHPIRHWDRFLGPRQRHLYAGALPAESQLHLTDLTPEPGRALDEIDLGPEFDVTPDGRTVVTAWWRETSDPRQRVPDLAAIDIATRARRVIAADGAWYYHPACSPDSRKVVSVRADMGAPDRAPERTLWLVDLATGQGHDLLEGFDRWPQHPVWLPEADALCFLADDGGHTLPFRVDVGTGAVTRLADQGAFTDLVAEPAGTGLYALRSSVRLPPRAVRLEHATPDQQPQTLPTPGDDVEPPGRLERLEATAADGTPVGSWLVLPADAAPDRPAPLVVFIHGGPFSSWNGWHWRWNPQVLAAAGWAVLLPDPALSTGYGGAFIHRGWGRWGAEPYTDLMAATDAAAARDDVDSDRMAAAGGSFGGYMANWVAGNTDRFRAIITHAGLWALDQFHGTSDIGVLDEREFGDPDIDPAPYLENSPRAHVAGIRTPMLVIHGERDFRVPVGEALRLWTDLARHGVPAKFLYFPDEHHWVLKPQNARIWYETVLAFLDHHVLDAAWNPPSLL